MSQELGDKNPLFSLSEIGLENVSFAYWNLYPSELIEDTIRMGDGVLTDTGAIAINTGEFTGRSPKDKFVVKDETTENSVWWGEVNNIFDPEKFDALYNRMTAYLSGKEVWIRDAYVCASPKYRLNLRVVNELPWGNLFSYNLFLRPEREEIKNFKHDWLIINAPGLCSDLRYCVIFFLSSSAFDEKSILTSTSPSLPFGFSEYLI